MGGPGLEAPGGVEVDRGDLGSLLPQLQFLEVDSPRIFPFQFEQNRLSLRVGAEGILQGGHGPASQGRRVLEGVGAARAFPVLLGVRGLEPGVPLAVQIGLAPLGKLPAFEHPALRGLVGPEGRRLQARLALSLGEWETRRVNNKGRDFQLPLETESYLGKCRLALGLDVDQEVVVLALVDQSEVRALVRPLVVRGEEAAGVVLRGGRVAVAPGALVEVVAGDAVQTVGGAPERVRLGRGVLRARAQRLLEGVGVFPQRVHLRLRREPGLG